jgi:hypothetical protein
MSQSSHFKRRMSQRGITQDMVDMVMGYGELDGDRVVLSRKASARLAKAARTLVRILDKGGVVVVASGSVQVTTYKYEGRSH